MDTKSIVMIVAQISLAALLTSVGLHARWREVLRTMRNFGLLGRAVLAVNVVVPLTAIIICGLLPIPQLMKVGIVIMSVSPLAPVLSLRLVQARVDASFAVGLDVALVLLSVIVVPLTIALLSSIFPVSASISPAAVAKLATLSVLMPLAVGMLVRAVTRASVERLAKMLTVLGYVGLGLVVIALLYAQARDAFDLIGSGVMIAILVTVLAGVVAGHFLAGSAPADKLAITLAATLRHPGLAALIAQRNFPNQKVELTIILYLLTAVAFSLLYQAWILKRTVARGPLPSDGSSRKPKLRVSNRQSDEPHPRTQH